MRGIVVLLFFCCLTGGCGSFGAERTEVVEIKEKLFIAQVTNMYINMKDYVGKNVKYQGIMGYYIDGESGGQNYRVFRQSPGCCGKDGVAGFDVIWDKEYPPRDAWVEVTGVLEAVPVKAGSQAHYPRLRVSALTVLDKEGARFVTQ